MLTGNLGNGVAFGQSCNVLGARWGGGVKWASRLDGYVGSEHACHESPRRKLVYHRRNSGWDPSCRLRFLCSPFLASFVKGGTGGTKIVRQACVAALPEARPRFLPLNRGTPIEVLQAGEVFEVSFFHCFLARFRFFSLDHII